MKGLRHYTARLAGAKKLFGPGRQKPVYLLMFVTNRCNAACEHCFYWRELNEKVHEELTLEEYERAARSLGAMLQVTLTGGSPELRGDFPEIAGIFARFCRPAQITFCMLGYASDRIIAQAERILKENPAQKFTFAISLDGIGEEHDRLRKLPGCFERATRTLKELGKMKATHRNLRLSVGTTVHALNYQTAEKTARWIRENLPVDVLKPILVRGDPLNRETLDRVCINTYLNVIASDREWLNGTRKGAFSPMDYLVNCKEAVSRRIIQELSTGRAESLVCAGGRETAVIYPTGDVAGCELRGNILGNLRSQDFDFESIWFNEAADRFRKSAGKVKECEGCYHHCFISPAIFRTPRYWPELVSTAWGIYRHNEKG